MTVATTVIATAINRCLEGFFPEARSEPGPNIAATNDPFHRNMRLSGPWLFPDPRFMNGGSSSQTTRFFVG